MEGKVSGLI